jgi:hypothetical protein
VICAVWYGDPRRHELVEGHARNLDAQTVPHERIYVFDNGDLPLAGVRGQTVAASPALTIYEAWNLALALVRTPYVINLNLDDRLAPDALVALERALDAGGDLAGGDWQICFSQEETDRVQPCRPAATLPLMVGWPPRRVPGTRLGSAQPNRTLGPACMWRLSLHAELARFPWKLDDGTKVNVIGDWIWWGLLRARGKRMVRVEQVIGNYHSHPNEQAEFRCSDDESRGLSRTTDPI